MGARPNPLVCLFMIWLMAAYLLITLFLDWTGFSSQSYSGVEAIAKLIPSIQPYAALSPNVDKATIELVLAWIFGLALPFVMLPALDWQWVNQRSARQGQLKTVLLLPYHGETSTRIGFVPSASVSIKTGKQPRNFIFA